MLKHLQGNSLVMTDFSSSGTERLPENIFTLTFKELFLSCSCGSKPQGTSHLQINQETQHLLSSFTLATKLPSSISSQFKNFILLLYELLSQLTVGTEVSSDRLCMGITEQWRLSDAKLMR